MLAKQDVRDEQVVQIRESFEQLVDPSHQKDEQLQRLYNWIADHRDEEWMSQLVIVGASPDVARTVLYTLSRHSDITPRRLVAGVLRNLRYTEAVPVLLNLLTDKRAEVRVVATDTLRSFAIPEVVPLFERMARDKSNGVRRAVARALLDVNAYSPSDSLAIGMRLTYDPDRETAGRAFYAIKKLRSTPIQALASAFTKSIRRYEPIRVRSIEPHFEREMLIAVVKDRKFLHDAYWSLSRTGPRDLPRNLTINKVQQTDVTFDQVRAPNEVRQPRNLYAGIGGMFENGVYKEGYPDWLSCLTGYEYDVYAGISPNEIIDYRARLETEIIGPDLTELFVGLIPTDTNMLEVVSDPVIPLSVPKVGRSNFVHFRVRGKKPGDCNLLILVYYKGALLIRMDTSRINIKSLPGEIKSPDAPSLNAPIAGTTLSYAGELLQNVETIQKERQANLFIDKVNDDPNLLFALYYQDENGSPHLLSGQSLLKVGEESYDAMCERLLSITNTKSNAIERLEGLFGSGVQLTLTSRMQTFCLEKLREASKTLRTSLFLEPEIAPIFEKLKQLANETHVFDTLQIVSRYRFLPWQLLYMGDNETVVCIDEFLGMRFQIEHLLAQGMGLCYWHKTGGDKLPIAFINRTINDNDEVQQNRKIVSNIMSSTDIRYSEKDVLDEICRTANPHPLIYFFCHGEHDPERIDRTCLRITDDDHQLTLEDMSIVWSDSKSPTFDCAPLIFINACTSAQVGSEIDNSFVGFFLDNMKAGGVIGTETTVPAFFATHFARLFWIKLLQERKTVGDALFETRRFFWEQHGNPCGLLYSLYANAECRISS